MFKISKGPSQEAWAQHRPLFTRLYCQEKKTLKEIRALFASQYGFKASLNMYKKRIRMWGLHKNRKEVEMRAFVFVALKRQSAGKQSRFRIRGRQSELREAQNYFKRKGLTDLIAVSAQNTRSSTPSELSCSTVDESPEPQRSSFLEADDLKFHKNQKHVLWRSTSAPKGHRPHYICPTVSTPDQFRKMELLLVGARDYFRPSSFEFAHTIVREDLMYSLELQEFERYAHKAAVCSDAAEWKTAAFCYDQALARVSGILKGRQSLNFLVSLFIILGCCESTHRLAIIPSMLQFVSEIATIIFSPTHPFCQLIQAVMKSLPLVFDMMELCLQRAVDILSSENLAFDPRTRIIAYGLYETLFSRGKFLQARALIQQSWQSEQRFLGKDNPMTLCSMIAIAKCAIEQDDYVGAQETINDSIQRMYLVNNNDDRYRLRTHVQVHIESCVALQKRGIVHRRLVDAYYGALDNKMQAPPSFSLVEIDS